MKSAAVSRIAMPAVLAVIASATTACFASVAQLDEVNEQVEVTRAEVAAADSIRATQLAQILATLRAVNDSIASLSQRMTRIRAETQADVRGMRQEVNQILEVSGQSEKRLKELRDQVDARNRQPPAPAVAPPAVVASGDTVTAMVTPVETEPGPSELLQIGRDQLTRGGNRAARAAFSDLLTKYPQSEYAADAQFYLAESHAAEGTRVAADSAYARVVSTYPDSPRAPTALYKRGVMAQTAGRRIAARRLFNELVAKYPSSDEAELARERLRVLT